MNALAELDTVVDRERLVELSYSLYECLSDLITDCESITHDTNPDIDGLIERIAVSAMNCLGDMQLLTPMFDALMVMRDELRGYS
jgi:hypothetical protein